MTAARALRDSGIIVWRQLVQLPRIPEVLIFSLIQPVMFVLLFRYVFGGAIATPGESYVNYLMPGIFAQTVAFGAVASGIGLAEDLRRGIIDRFRSLPMARSAVLVGRTVSDLVRNAVVVGVMYAVGLAVGFRPEGSIGAQLVAFGLLLLTSFAFSWIGVVIALSMKTVEAVQSAGFIWLFPPHVRQLGVRAHRVDARLAAGLRRQPAVYHRRERRPCAVPGAAGGQLRVADRRVDGRDHRRHDPLGHPAVPAPQRLVGALALVHECLLQSVDPVAEITDDRAGVIALHRPHPRRGVLDLRGGCVGVLG